MTPVRCEHPPMVARGTRQSINDLFTASEIGAAGYTVMSVLSTGIPRPFDSLVCTQTRDGQRHDPNGSKIQKLPDSLLIFCAGLEPSMTHDTTIMKHSAETYYKFYLNSISSFMTNATLGGIQTSSTGPSLSVRFLNYG